MLGRVTPNNTGYVLPLVIPTPNRRGYKAMMLSCLSEVCLSVTYIGPKSRTERPRKTKMGTRHTWLRHHFQSQKVIGQGHQAALLTAVLTRQAVQQWAWERIGRGKLLLRCGVRRFGAHRGRRGAGAYRGGRPLTACLCNGDNFEVSPALSVVCILLSAILVCSLLR